MEVGRACSLLICLSATLILCKAYMFIEPKNPTVDEHQSLSLYCNTTNNVPFNFTWTKKTELDNIFQSNSNNLTFDRILRTHAGYYICNASYQGLTYINYSLVTVRYSPDITRLTSNTTTVNMSQITLECNTTGNPTPNVSFYKDGKRLNSSKGQVVLTLSPVLVQDSGLYTCEASNPLGNKSKTTYLDVQYPTKVSKPAHNLTINAWLGKFISQDCKAIGNPTPNVTWYWNNTVVSTTRVLNITITSGNQFGVYRCFAWNNLGNVSRDIHLNRTRFRPGITKIINNVTLLISQNITLKWSKPNEYGSNITQYIVWKQKIYKNGTQERWESYSSPSTNHKKYFNLTWGASYRFYVTAKNRQGKRDGETKNFSVIDAPTIKPAEHKKEHELHLLVIVGSAAAGLVVLIIIICVLCYFRCKESTNDKKPSCPKEGNFNHSVLMDDLTSPYGDNVGSPNSPTERYSKTHRALTDIHQESASCSEQAAIYDNVSFDDKSVQGWEIPRDNVRIEKIIGKGAFCQVAKAFVKGLGTVAVKMIRSKNKGNKSSISNREDLLAEYELLQHLGQHENVILVLGGVTTTDPVMVFFEYVPYGDLLGYLRRSRGLTDTYYTDPDIKPTSSLTSKQLLRFSREIADGMAFISSKKIIHRDLAARNVLVGQGETCKITDFGMARDVKMDDIYQKKRRGGLPVKWTAYEALLYGFYSTQSDIWSYAIVLYEIFTIGGSPYPGISPRDIAEQIYKEYRMPKPKHLDDEIYALMCECWKTTPDKRPSFESISSTLRRLERHEKDYIHMMDYEKDLYANLDEL